LVLYRHYIDWCVSLLQPAADSLTLSPEIGGQILIVFVGGAAFHVTPIGGQEWGIALALGIGSIPLGAFVRLLPSDPFERLFERVGLLGHPDVLPRASPNSDTVEWNAVTRVQHNLDTFINVRGGRVRSSSVVTQNRTARPSQEQARPAYAPSNLPTERITDC
jgi:Ca2+-transporting ATPase